MSTGTYTDGERRTYTPAESFAGKVGFAVKISTTGGDPDRAVRLATNGVDFLGVILMEGSGGAAGVAPAPALHVQQRFCTVQTTGTCMGVAGAAIARGAAVTVNAAGKFITAAIGNTVIGVAEEAVAADGQPFSLRIARRGAVV